MSDLEPRARELFMTDDYAKDRVKYKTWERVPPELKEWWRDRAQLDPEDRT